ncbi:MAG: DUF4230 domain-containing protein [Candidatus Eisenbacteria bacterium]|nr:DUF4230 domain-containing protein [Candidatus Eisenbacteria bacterium]
MDTLLVGFVIGLAAAVFVAIAFRRSRRPREVSPSTEVHSFVTGLRAVSELSVFRIRTKEIITASDHWFGGFGKRYLSWLISTKRMTMIFEFDVDFRYNLASPEMAVSEDGRGGFTVRLPPCSYEVRILDMRMHSEKGTELLPWLMPEMVNRFITGGFSVEQKNALIDEAKDQAVRLAADLVSSAEGDAQTSARRSIEMFARGFNADRVSIGFAPTTEFHPRIDATRIEGLLDRPAGDE